MDFVERIRGIAALDKDTRRATYDVLVRRGEWVSRDEVADEVDVPRSVAAFHLDRLEEVGLVEARYARTTGRSGPGAGRPAKLYRRTSDEVTVSLPERRYAFVAKLLAEAVDATLASGRSLREELKRAARRAGREFAQRIRERTAMSPEDALVEVLSEEGYEPQWTDEGLVLRNCPFHALAQSHQDLVCGVNHDLLSAVSKEAGTGRAKLDPSPGLCCVRFEGRPTRRS